MRRITAPCGLICSECDAFAATQASDAAAIAAVAEAWRERYGLRCEPADIWCDGCTSTSARTAHHCRECPIRPCARDRGLATCAECSQYPCKQVSRAHRIAPEARETLAAIRRGARAAP